jgi:hypothetical protein
MVDSPGFIRRPRSVAGPVLYRDANHWNRRSFNRVRRTESAQKQKTTSLPNEVTTSGGAGEVKFPIEPLDILPTFANLSEKRRTQWALTAEEMKECRLGHKRRALSTFVAGSPVHQDVNC